MDVENDEDIDDDVMSSDRFNPASLSRNQVRRATHLTVAEIRMRVSKPALVDGMDANADEPLLHVALKSMRGSVPVPSHWASRSKYLKSKRIQQARTYELPDYIKATGVMQMRELALEKDAEKTLRSRMREHVMPKLGRMNLDYEKLRAAFYKHQRPPEELLKPGDLYYEGRELDTRLKWRRQFCPGVRLSAELNEALGLTSAANEGELLGQQGLVSVPWLFAMQRIGNDARPPPAYPEMLVPGVNAPVPEGASLGSFAGSWGHPPDSIRERYAMPAKATASSEMQPTLWGAMVDDLEESEDEEVDTAGENEDENEDEQEADQLDIKTSNEPDVPVTKLQQQQYQQQQPSIPPERVVKEESTAQLFTEISQRPVDITGKMGAQFVYDIPGTSQKRKFDEEPKASTAEPAAKKQNTAPASSASNARKPRPSANDFKF
ncbi:DUF382-domain-containing protein [Ramicandelaber brevisporus]|nr:DUF382-domain-containing protein [Ramicandelaber brevisporus]